MIISWPWDQLSALVLSPGVPLTHPRPHGVVQKARAAGVEVIGDIELFARAVNAMPPEVRPKIVTVTGSNGKSTTTALIAHILRETGHKVYEGGNIGNAVLSMPPLEENAIYVLELSSYQLDLTKSLRSDICVFLNLSPDHLDRHGGMDGYIAAKRRIFNNQQKDDIAVIGVDDAISQSICTDLISGQHAKIIPVSAMGTLGNGVFVLGAELFYNFDHKTTSGGKIPDVSALHGRHNHQNAAAAFAVCNSLGVSPPVAMLAMAKFKGLPHRMEKIAQIGGVTFVNDSKATNADAVSKALTAFKSIYWIAGGQAKEDGIRELQGRLKSVEKAYFFGDCAMAFHEQVNGDVESRVFKNMQHAVYKAFSDALAGLSSKSDRNPIILLSPAAASFDQFKNFEARGEAFRKIVEKIAAEGGQVA